MVQGRVNTHHSKAFIKRNQPQKPAHHYPIQDYRHVQAKIDAKKRLDEENARRKQEEQRHSQPTRLTAHAHPAKPAVLPEQQPPERLEELLGDGKSLSDVDLYLKPMVEEEEQIKFTLNTLPKFVCNKCRKRWRWCQGYYPARGGAPQEPVALYEPPHAHIKDTESKHKLKTTLDVRIIRYPEPLSQLHLTSNPLEPKNYKIMVDNQVLYYSFDYTPYMANISHYIQQFSQLILDPHDNITVSFDCYKFPNDIMCCHACLTCRRCRINYPENVCYLRAPNGHLMGRIVRTRPKRFLYTKIGFDIYGTDPQRILRIRKQCFFRNSLFTIVTGDKTKRMVGTIKRRLVPDSKFQLIPNHYDYKILFELNPYDAVVKLLVIGACFLIDFMGDKSYRPFIRYGSRVTPTFRGRFNQ